MPPVRESAEELLSLRRLERDERRRERLHGLWLLASGGAKNRLELAAALARNRETIAAWLDLYAAGGLPALLAPAFVGPSSRPAARASCWSCPA